MLLEIKCDKFRQGVVKFGHGLNVVLGDENATNSIGKSSLLMVIDFVFGGNTLLKHNVDIIKELGHHDYNFAFEFDGERYNFRRSTLVPENVFSCDSAYEVESTMQLSRFTTFLKRAYGLAEPDQSFRSAVGLHLRIWGKSNLIPDRPLHTEPRQSTRDCVENLIKTFGVYGAISDRENALRVADANLKLVRAAGNSDLIPKVTKSRYLHAQTQIASLESDLEDIRRNLAAYATNLGAVINEEILDLKLRKDDLLQRRVNLAGRLQRLDRNLGGRRSLRSAGFQELRRFFPEINVERLAEVEAFHDGVARILKQQLQDAKVMITDELKSIDAELASIDQQMAAALSSIDKPESLVDHVYKVSLSLEEAKADKLGYEREAEHVLAYRNAKDALADEKHRILNDIASTINTGMREIVSEAAGDDRKSPHLALDDASYSFEVHEDTGTGTAYFGLVVFDLAVFRSTSLPVIAHDSILFKNISNDSVAHLVDLYGQSQKQSFIALDEISKYGSKAVRMLENRCVARLSNDSVLYVKDWRPSRPSAQPSN